VIVSTLAGLILGLGFAFLREVMSAASRIGRPPLAPAMPVKAETKAPSPEAAPPPHQPRSHAEPTVVDSPFQLKPDPVLAQPRPTPPVAATPSLCEIPHAADAKTAIRVAAEVLSYPSGTIAQSIARLSDWLDRQRQSASVNRLAIVALQPGGFDVGVATAALARVRAMRGERVIAVDAASGATNLEETFGVQREAGFADLLTGRARFSDVIIKDQHSDAHILPAGARRALALNYLVSDRVQAIFQELGDVYDLVLVHAGSLTGISESVVRRCHGALLFAPPEAGNEATATLTAWQKAGFKAVELVHVASAQARRDSLGLMPSLNG
jgi:Mrp family chromosome partitioning ATPase